MNNHICRIENLEIDGKKVSFDLKDPNLNKDYKDYIEILSAATSLEKDQIMNLAMNDCFFLIKLILSTPDKTEKILDEWASVKN